MTTSLLWLLFWLPGKNRLTFSCKKTVINILYGHLVNMAKFFWPIGDHINRVPLYLFAGEANKFYKSNSFPSKGHVMYVALVSIVTVK